MGVRKHSGSGVGARVEGGGGGGGDWERGPFSGGTAVGGEATARSGHGWRGVKETAQGEKTPTCCLKWLLVVDKSRHMKTCEGGL